MRLFLAYQKNARNSLIQLQNNLTYAKKNDKSGVGRWPMDSDQILSNGKNTKSKNCLSLPNILLKNIICWTTVLTESKLTLWKM